jgi:hypothetical protein
MRFGTTPLLLAVIASAAGPSFGQEKAVQNPDSCIVPISAFSSDLEKNLRDKLPANSTLRKVALDLLSGRLKKVRLTARPRGDFLRGLDQNLKIEPLRKGEFTNSGITWKWELQTILGQVEIFEKADLPVFARFKADVRLTVSTDSPGDRPRLFQAVSRPDRWFYIVRGKGQEQDGTIAPKNAPGAKEKDEVPEVEGHATLRKLAKIPSEVKPCRRRLTL